MQLRNGKQYSLSLVNNLSSDNPQTKLTPYIESIITLFKKYIYIYVYTYDYKNGNSINKTTKNIVIQQIRDFREFYYLVEYYFESIQTPNFSNFIIACKNKANTLVLKLNEILNRSGKKKGFRLTEHDKMNAKGLLQDLERFLQLCNNLCN
jgi:hypothetical protein